MSTTALFTLDDYDHMIACGAFEPPHHRRCELIKGEIRDMSPIGPEHGEMVDILDDWSHEVKRQYRMRVRVQSSIGISQLSSAPEPDIVWAVDKSYASHRPIPSDILLLIEVAQSSLQYDLGEKTEIYAVAGIEDYWVVDIPNRQVHVHRKPTTEGYQSTRTFSADDVLTPSKVEIANLNLVDLFSSLD